MDHIPKPFSAYSHIEVPYLYDESCPYIYHNKKGAFGTYPERCGWEKIVYAVEAMSREAEARH
jgi:hypothetical protein